MSKETTVNRATPAMCCTASHAGLGREETHTLPSLARVDSRPLQTLEPVHVEFQR
jgi:hypothetical protein